MQVILRIAGFFWTFFILRYSRNQKTQCFRNWICFRPQVRGETPIQLGSLDRVNLAHWTST
jgi:hypothetical protein